MCTRIDVADKIPKGGNRPSAGRSQRGTRGRDRDAAICGRTPQDTGCAETGGADPVIGSSAVPSLVMRKDSKRVGAVFEHRFFRSNIFSRNVRTRVSKKQLNI